MKKCSTFEIDGHVQTLTPPDNFQQYEGVCFSSSGRLLAIAAAGANSVFVFRRKASGLFEESPWRRIGGLNFPHDVAFAPSGNCETLAVTERRGVISIWEINRSNEDYGDHPAFVLYGPQTELNYSDGVTFVPPDNDYIAACNLSSSTITFYRRISHCPTRFRSRPEFVLRSPCITGPDGLAFSACGNWLAVANHAGHSASIFQRRKAPSATGLEYGPEPVTVIRDPGFRHPHSMAFTPGTNHLVVTNSGANYFSVFAPEPDAGETGRWSQQPLTQETFCPAPLFNQINGLNKMEGGPKGIAIHQNTLAVCSPEQGAKIYAFRDSPTM